MVVCDMTDLPEVDGLAKARSPVSARSTSLVNNAGTNIPQPIDQITTPRGRPDAAQLTSVMRLTRALVPR